MHVRINETRHQNMIGEIDHGGVTPDAHVGDFNNAISLDQDIPVFEEVGTVTIEYCGVSEQYHVATSR
jgi:hypothetical protein